MTLVTYPAHLETDVVLRSGRTLHIRPVRHEDAAAMRAFLAGLSSDALYSRFFHVLNVDAAVANAPVDVDYEDVVGLVGESGGAILGVAHYFRSKRDLDSAEGAVSTAGSLPRARGRTRPP